MIYCRLKELMLQHNLYDLGQLAKKLDIPKETLENLAENRWHQIKREHLDSICSFFNCKVGDVLVYELPSGGELPA